MKEINLAQNITLLRKRNNVTQEQLAQALNISPQAVSKWETNTSQPDTQTLPLIAEYFHVSIDYLFYGDNFSYNDIYLQNQQKTASFEQNSEESFEEALKIFASAHHGISHMNLLGKELMYDRPAHISSEGGLSLLSGKGYAALVTRRFFENIRFDTVSFSVPLLKALADEKSLYAAMGIISMSDISFAELRDKLNMTEPELEEALRPLIENHIVHEKASKHKALGRTYEITEIYHSCLCILLATLEMQRFSLEGINCCMGYGDYPVKFEETKKA